jgi:hypothetical protein
MGVPEERVAEWYARSRKASLASGENLLEVA